MLIWRAPDGGYYRTWQDSETTATVLLRPMARHPEVPGWYTSVGAPGEVDREYFEAEYVSFEPEPQEYDPALTYPQREQLDLARRLA